MGWKQAKRERAKQIGWICEVCGKLLTARKAVGHHKIYRRTGIKDDSVKNCELRCRSCEQRDPHK